MLVAQSPALAKTTVSANVTHADINKHYEGGTSASVSAFFEPKDSKLKYGFDLAHLDAWGQQTTYASARGIATVSDLVYLTGGIGGSSSGTIAAKYRTTGMVNVKMPSMRHLVLGLGFDHYGMRGGAKADVGVLQVLYYARSMPLVTQASVSYGESRFNSRGGARVGLAMTYGYVGKWNIIGRVSSGRVHYELISQPGTVADYNGTTVGLSGRYWLSKAWAINGGVSVVNNDHYRRQDVRLGLSYDF